MSTAYFNLIGGLSGDMLLSSFFDAGLDEKKVILELKKIKDLNFEFNFSKTKRKNITATHTNVILKDSIKWEWQKFYEVVEKSDLSETIISKIINCFDLLKSAEQDAHEEENPHLHELGTSDTLVDVCGFFISADILGIETFFCSPLPVVPGFIKTSHGIHETLAPATKKIVERFKIPLKYINNSSNIETITPTGISIIASCASFKDTVSISSHMTGTGAGTKDFKNFPNVLSVVLDTNSNTSIDKSLKYLLETNIDDMSPEFIGNFINLSISEGALDCWVSSYTGKKNRLGNNINILCNENEKDKFINLIIKETSSLGVRSSLVERYEAKRKIEKFKSSLGYIQVKLKYFDGQLHSVKPEFDDLKKISQLKGYSIYNITNIIIKEINDKYFNLN
tara:strand:+ start:1289 stop:2473 length:1185 start_codon:yes stop_codon:yes gene_type:complete